MDNSKKKNQNQQSFTCQAQLDRIEEKLDWLIAVNENNPDRTVNPTPPPPPPKP